MAEVDLDKVRELAESAERRAKERHKDADAAREVGNMSVHHSLLNDFFYWSGKATSYRGIIAMCELATIVEDELDSQPSCP